jgi:hypothetical protein
MTEAPTPNDQPMTPNDRNPRQVALSAFENDKRMLADGGVVASSAADAGMVPPTYEQPYTEGDTPYSHYEDAGKYGIMYAGFYKWDDVRCTAEAYGDSQVGDGRRSSTKPSRSLQFHTEWVDAETAKECIREIGGYNRFDPEHVAAAIDDMPSDTWFVVGRESSPVIYAWTDRAETLVDVFEESGSEAYYRQQELYHELSAIEDERDTDEALILKSPSEAEGRLREVLVELEAIDSCVAGAPDELTAYPDAEQYPHPCAGSADAPPSGTPTLVRAWWD